ncbi:MAG: hypothetical protein ACRD2N_12370 [Vicinamibacterales bacterium]
MKLSTVRRSGRVLVLLTGVLGVTSCASELTRTGRSSGYMIIDSLGASSGAEPGTFTSQLNSDVITLVDQQINGQTVKVPTVFNDSGQASMRVAMKNPTAPTSPTELNDITVTRYRVVFRRADGRNTPGVDVPYGFDGGVTATLGSNGTPVTFGFELVRHQMKQEPPLRNLRNSGGANLISTIAEVTFYGRDQAGNEVSVTGSISVNFGDFGDPK